MWGGGGWEEGSLYPGVRLRVGSMENCVLGPPAHQIEHDHFIGIDPISRFWSARSQGGFRRQKRH